MAEPDAVAVVRRLHTALGRPDALRVATDLFADDFVSHNIPPGLPTGVEGVRAWYEALLAGIPDLEIEIVELIAEGDRVAVATTLRGTHTGELLGAPPTGRPIAVAGIDMLRIADGKIAEHRGLTDTVGLLRQIAGR